MQESRTLVQLNNSYCQIIVSNEDGAYNLVLKSDGMFREYIGYVGSGILELRYLNMATTKHAMQEINANTLVFKDIPSEARLDDILRVVNAIIDHERIRRRFASELVDAIRAMGDADIETNDAADLVVFNDHSNVSLYVNEDRATVFCHSYLKKSKSHIFEDRMKFKFDDVDWANDKTNTLVFEGKEYPDLGYIENGTYEFSFDFPRDMERIREHVLVLARILLA